MKLKNYYKVLGVKRTASTAEIRKRFKELAKLYHPDRNRESKVLQVKFAEVCEAYKVLGNLDKRLEYSQKLHANKINQQLIALKDYEYRKKNNIKLS